MFVFIVAQQNFKIVSDLWFGEHWDESSATPSQMC